MPDNSRPKAPPSLLADGPGNAASAPTNGTPTNGSRILANLEGRVVPPAAPAGKAARSSKAAALVALCVIGAGAFGAWHWMTRTPSALTSSASVAASTMIAAASASQTVAASAQTGVADEASTSHAATIVADDEAASAAAGNTGSAPAGDAGMLSRALANGAQDSSASGATVAAAAAAQDQAPKAQTQEKGAAKRQTANARRDESKTIVAQQKKPHNGSGSGAKKDDSDVDRLAVLVARTKPADAKTAAKAQKNAAKPASDSNAPLAQQVKECSERGFFEDQLCRWRVCDGHWGKDTACPSTSKASSEH